MKYLYECSPVKPLGSGGLNIQLLKCHSTPTCCTSMLLTAPAPSGLVKVWLLLGQHKEASAPFLQQGDPKPTIRFATRWWTNHVLCLINSPVYFTVPQHRIFFRCWMLVKTFMARLLVAPTATRIVLFFQQELGLQDVTRQLQSLYGKLTVAKCWTRPTKVWQHVDVTWFDLICNFLVFRMFASYFLGAGFCCRFTIIQPCFCCIRWCLHRSKLDRALPSSQHLPTLWVQNPVADNRAGRCSCNQFLVLWDKWM